MMDLEKYEEIIFGIITNAGEARGFAFEALEYAEMGQYEKSERCMKQSSEAFLAAHHIQTDLIQRETAGETMPVSLLFVHAQDHLMTALSEKNLIERLIRMSKRINELEGR